jgi:hypothetical protein
VEFLSRFSVNNCIISEFPLVSAQNKAGTPAILVLVSRFFHPIRIAQYQLDYLKQFLSISLLAVFLW